jgi:Mor family transcriptional regulator
MCEIKNLAEFLDFLSTVIAREAGAEVAGRIISTIRRRWGGERLYIPLRGDPQKRDAHIRAEFKGRNVRALAEKYGVSKATVWRMVRKSRDSSAGSR